MSSWTPKDQKERDLAINTIDSNVLVSASAGSGKTHIMMERVGTMAKGEIENCDTMFDVVKFMIVTFTKASAKELKYKVADTLLEAIQNISSEIKKERDVDKKKQLEDKVVHLKKQMEELPLASISTIHSLCSQIVRQYFQQADVDPAFIVMEEDESELLFNKAVSNVLRNVNESPTEDYLRLLKFFGDDSLKEALNSAYGFIRNNINYKENIEAQVMALYQFDIKDTKVAKAYTEYVIKKISATNKIIKAIEDIIPKLVQKEQDVLTPRVAELRRAVELIESVKDIEDLIAKYKTIKFSNMSSISGDPTDVELYTFAKNLVAKEKAYFAQIGKVINGFDIEQEKALIAKDISLVKEFAKIIALIDEEYSSAKKDENRLDFNDLEQKTVLLLQDGDILAALKDKFDFLFVDECQDVNPLQDYIMKTISKGDNLFMVGDLKQSIYGFRKSDPSLFKERYDAYEADESLGKAIELNTNFRSKQEILDFVNEVFAPIMSNDFGGVDYSSKAMLYPCEKNIEEGVDRVKIGFISKKDVVEEEAKDEAAEAEEVVDFNLDDDNIYSVKNHDYELNGKRNDKEAQYIVKKINEVLDKVKEVRIDPKTGEEVEIKYQLSDIAILFEARNEDVKNIIDHIRQDNKAIDASNATKASKNHDISLLISLLNVIDNDKQDVALANVLLSVFGGFTAAELAKINSATPRIKGKIENFYQVFNLYDDTSDKALCEKIEAFKALIEKYRFEAQFTCVADLIENIIDDTLFDEYVLAQENGESSLNQIKTFVKELRGKNYNSSISKFLSTYREYDSIDTTKEVFNISSECIKTSTIHGSKGLQYPVVFVVNASKGDSSNRDKYICQRDSGFVIKHFDEDTLNYSDSLTFKLTNWAKQMEEKEEKMRLLYVALTRAEDYLYISGMSDTGLPDYESFDIDPVDAKNMCEWIQCASSHNKDFKNKYLDLDSVGIKYEKIEKAGGITEPSTCDINDGTLVSALNSLTLENYEYKTSTESPLWYSVTQLNKGGIDVEIDEENIPTEIDMEAYFGDSEDTTPEIGTAYHRVLELLDFDKDYTVEEIDSAKDEMVKNGDLEPEQSAFVESIKIKRFLDSGFLAEIKGRKQIKEQGFRMYTQIPEEIMGKEIKDKVLVQGTFDLFIPREGEKESVLIDYKFSNKNYEEIVKTYTKQMRLYKLAIEKCLNEKVDKMCIYVLGRGERITIK